MNYLLDTNILLWVFENHPKLSKSSHKILQDPANTFYVSIVSLWEIAIKLSIGKLSLGQSLDDIINKLDQQNVIILPISIKAVKSVKDLPYHHRDPFDRILVAQAQVDDLIVMTNDKKFEEYGVKLVR